MQQVIIIEGCNKSGKTTIVNKLLETYSDKNFNIIKCNQPRIHNGKNYAFEQYIEILDLIKQNPDKNYIIDRFHFGSFVYGPIYRGENDFSLEKFVEIEEKIMEFNYTFILAIASRTFMKKKFKEENEEFAKEELIEKEIEHFRKIAKLSRLNIFHHNLPKKDIMLTNKIIIE